MKRVLPMALLCFLSALTLPGCRQTGAAPVEQISGSGGSPTALPDVDLPAPPSSDGIVRHPDGSTRYILLVPPDFRPEELAKVGAKLEWYWADAGIAVANSFRKDFAVAAPGVGVSIAVPAALAFQPPPERDRPSGNRSPAPTVRGGEAPDAYLLNLQWHLQAIGAVRHPDGRTPEWQLTKIDGHDYQGLGTTVCYADSGMPTMVTREGLRLHQDFDWFKPGSGGVVPVFKSEEEFNAYYASFGKEEGLDPSTRIIDPMLGGFDEGNHATGASAIFAVRYRPGAPWATRGIAPSAKVISYASSEGGWHDVSELLYAFRRATTDGCQVLAVAWGVFFQRNAAFALQEEYRQIFMHALQSLNRANILVTSPAGNWGFDVRDLQESAEGPWWVFPQRMATNVVVVSATGPRDYSPSAPDLRVYDPTPGVPRGPVHNLDRLGAFGPPNFSTCFGIRGGGIDLAAPSGSQAAPFNEILVPSREWDAVYGFHTFAGHTSQAMPLVAGVASLAIEAYTRAHGKPPSADTLKTVLLRSADDQVGPARDTLYRWSAEKSASGSVVIDSLTDAFDSWEVVEVDYDKPGRDAFLGFGRINAFRAIEEARRTGHAEKETGR